LRILRAKEKMPTACLFSADMPTPMHVGILRGKGTAPAAADAYKRSNVDEEKRNNLMRLLAIR
jgi:hypothetical protein